MERYALINEKKKLPKGFIPFKKGHGKKKDKEDSKDKKKNPFASLKKESADIYATMDEAPMSGDDMQLQQDAGMSNEEIIAEYQKNDHIIYSALKKQKLLMDMNEEFFQSDIDPEEGIYGYFGAYVDGIRDAFND